jgi:RNase P/RNase MRP subunit p29
MNVGLEVIIVTRNGRAAVGRHGYVASSPFFERNRQWN